MTTEKLSARIDRKSMLSTAWIFVLLNVIFRDLHELFRPGMLQEMLSGTVNGVTVTDQVLLLGGIMLQIPLAMVLLSRVLPDRASRWANVVAALAAIAIVLVPTLVTSTPDPDDLLFAAAELVGLLFIIGSAWTWRPASITTAGPTLPRMGDADARLEKAAASAMPSSGSISTTRLGSPS